MEQAQRSEYPPKSLTNFMRARENAIKLLHKVERWDSIYTYRLIYVPFTITPRGKKKTHKELKKVFLTQINQIKSVSSVILIAEKETTNHFHGVLTLKSKCKLARLYRKTNSFTFYRSDAVPLLEWLAYILKTNPQIIHTGDCMKCLSDYLE